MNSCVVAAGVSQKKKKKESDDVSKGSRLRIFILAQYTRGFPYPSLQLVNCWTAQEDED